MANVALEWLSRGCNWSSRCLSSAGYDECSFRLAYGAGSSVIEWETASGRAGEPALRRSAVSALRVAEDAGQVTAVKVLPKQRLVLAGTSTGNVLTLQDGVIRQKDALGSDAGIASVQAVTASNGQALALVSTQSGVLKVYEMIDDNWTLFADWQMPENVLPISLSANLLGSNLIVFVGGTDKRIWIYTVCRNSGLVCSVAQLHGHRDWIRALDVYTIGKNSSELLLASGSNDSTVRIWRLTADEEVGTGLETEDFLGAPRTKFSLSDGQKMRVQTETIISEHAEKVTDVRWHVDHPCLVVASMDASVTVWCPSLAQPKTWIMKGRFGLFGGLGAHATGFFGASFVNDSPSVVAHSPSGALYLWTSENSFQDKSFRYAAKSAPAGHSAAVHDICWDAEDGSSLLSCSEDKTARIYKRGADNGEWHEMYRPQVHGHALYTAVFVEGGRRFVSGGEEKMLRSFKAPDQRIATIPALGLSNRPSVVDGQDLVSDTGVVDEGTEEEGGGGFTADGGAPIEIFGADKAVSSHPVEEDLIQSCLWPEVAKLYGHGNELSCVASSPARNAEDEVYLASACRSQSARHAAIIMWDTTNWSEQDRLEVHELTVTQMSFAGNRQGLLSVSRDRSFAVFTGSAADGRFRLQRRERPHTRQIHCGAWGTGDSLFATGSRDKTLRLFRGFESDGTVSADMGAALQGEGAVVKFSSGVSAIEFAPRWRTEWEVGAVGLENGEIKLLRWRVEGGSRIDKIDRPETIWTSPTSHVGKVRRVRWQPMGALGTSRLASCGDDGSVRIFAVRLE